MFSSAFAASTRDDRIRLLVRCLRNECHAASFISPARDGSLYCKIAQQSSAVPVAILRLLSRFGVSLNATQQAVLEIIDSATIPTICRHP
jgi:hypothetical protein